MKLRSSPSYKETKVDVRVADVTAGTNQRDAGKSFDDNELSEWKNDGRLNTARITYKLERRAEMDDDLCIKLTGWRSVLIRLEVYAGEHLIWSGNTEKSLGICPFEVIDQIPVHVPDEISSV
ncbi:MAG: hypothetical protein ACLUVG_16520 [Phocaeicola vulgatus]